MTRRERAQVVELLRCAADNLTPRSTGAWTDALNALTPTLEVEITAAEAFLAVKGAGRPFSRAQCEQGRRCYLEAAARVEEGTWP